MSWSLWWGQVKVLGNVSAPPEIIISFVQTFIHQSHFPIMRYHLQDWKWPHGTLLGSSQEQGPEYVHEWMPGVTLTYNENSANIPLQITCNQSPWAAKGLSGDTSVPATFWYIKYCLITSRLTLQWEYPKHHLLCNKSDCSFFDNGLEGEMEAVAQPALGKY